MKIGRIKGVQAAAGEWRVFGRNLLVPDIALYAPYANAVFGPVQDHLPFHVADKSPAAARASDSGLRASKRTSAPNSASAEAAARPIPWDPPPTMARFPARGCCMQ